MTARGKRLKMTDAGQVLASSLGRRSACGAISMSPSRPRPKGHDTCALFLMRLCGFAEMRLNGFNTGRST